MVITTAKLHLTKPEVRFCTGSNPAHRMLEICDGEDLWQWSRLEIRLKCLSPVNHTTKTTHHHHTDQVLTSCFCGGREESNTLVFLLNHLTFDSLLLVNYIWKIRQFGFILRHFLRKLKDVCLIKCVLWQETWNLLGLMDNKRNIFVLNQRCF